MKQAPQKTASAEQKRQRTGPRDQAASDGVLQQAQQQAGNQSIQHYFVQSKLEVSQADDPYEREADRVADQVMRQPADHGGTTISFINMDVQRKCSTCEAQEEQALVSVQRKQRTGPAHNNATARHAGKHDSIDFSAFQRGGKKIPEQTQHFFESRFGHTLDHVRLHTGADAAQATRHINAKAFTLSNHIAFAPGQFAPHTQSGQWLFAHELTHVLQQQSGQANRMIQRLGDNPYTDEWVSQQGQASHRRAQHDRQRQENWTRSHRDSFSAALNQQNSSMAEDIASSRSSLMQQRAAMFQQVMTNQAEAGASDLSGFSAFFQKPPHLPPDLMQNWTRAELAKEALHTAIEANQVSDEIAEASRSSLSVFFQSLLQATQAQERHEAEVRAQYQQLQSDIANSNSNTSTQCHGGCHPSAPQPSFGPNLSVGLPSHAGSNSATAGEFIDNNARFDANPEGWVNSHTDSIVIKIRVAMHVLNGAKTVSNWQRVLTEYGSAKDIMDKLLLQRLPRTSKMVEAFQYAKDLLSRQERLQSNYPSAVKIPAVYYPNEQFATVNNEAGGSQTVANGIPWMFYLTKVENPSDTQWAENFEWELHDLTSAGRPSVRFKPNNVLKILSQPGDFVDPPVALFEQLNHKLKFPLGYLYWTAPSGQRWSMATTEPWTLSDWLTAIGVSLAVLGIVLGTAGYGTPAAIALGLSAGFGASSTLANLAEVDEHNLLTQKDINRAALSIALDVVSALTLGFGRVASISLQTSARAAATGAQGAAMAARASSMAARASRLWFVSQTAATAGEGINLFVAGHDFIQQARMISNQKGMTDDQRNASLARLVLTGLATGGLMILSLRGNMKDLQRGTPLHIDIDPDTGAPRLRPDTDPQIPRSSPGATTDAAEGAAHSGIRPGARGDLELTGQTGLRNAAGESHEFGLWQDGKLTRCSDHCTELTDNVLARMRRMRERVPPNSAYIEELKQVAVSAQALRQEAAAAAGDAGTLTGRRQQLLDRARGLEMRASMIEEQVNRELSAFYTRAPPDWPVRQVDYDTLPRDLAGNIDTLPHGIVYEFPGGHRVWRLRGGGIAHESYVGPAHGRQGFEKEFYRPGEVNRTGYHRAHTLGQGTGFESPFAIPYAPAKVNLAIQNDGIEEFLRGLRDEAPAGAHFHLRTETHMRPGSLDLDSITYRIEASQGGRRAEFFEFDIKVTGPPDSPTITYSIPTVTQNPELAALFDMVDVPERVKNRWARARAARARRSTSN